jgi:S-adenosylmethionine:tRNA ribosyltransferase-isomerase
VHQWDPYEIKVEKVNASQALEALLNWMHSNHMPRLVTKTQIMIAPGYEMKLTSGLVTNFHQPQSTLLLLIAAFIGDDWRKVYDYALENQFRFLSYGDGCLLFRNSSFS